MSYYDKQDETHLSFEYINQNGESFKFNITHKGYLSKEVADVMIGEINNLIKESSKRKQND